MRIVFCLPGRSYSGHFLVSMVDLTQRLSREGIQFAISQKYSSVVYYARNMCLGGNNLMGEHQLPWQGSLEYDYVLWIDSDINFLPDQVFRLLETAKSFPDDIDILSGTYLMENRIQYATVVEWEIEYFKKFGTFKFMSIDDVKSFDKTELLSVAYTGFGFMLIKKGVFESIGYPWFRPLWEEIKLDNGIVAKDFTSEDVGFCRMATEKGYKIFVDLNINVGHEKLQVIKE